MQLCTGGPASLRAICRQPAYHRRRRPCNPPTLKRLEVRGGVLPRAQLQLRARGQLGAVWRLRGVEPALDGHARLVAREHLLRE